MYAVAAIPNFGPSYGSSNGTHTTAPTQVSSCELFCWYSGAILGQRVDIISSAISSGRTMVRIVLPCDAQKCRIAE